MIPRGVRNNNPGNLEPVVRWTGLVGSDGRFAKFSTPYHGIRAIGVDLRAKVKRGLTTPREVISEYAPPNENDTEAYIRAVTSFVGIGAESTIPVHDAHFIELWMKAIVRHENGKGPPGNPFWFDDEFYRRAALDVARPLAATRTSAGAATAATGAAGTAATVVLQNAPVAVPTAPPVPPTPPPVMDGMGAAMEKLPEVVGSASDVATTAGKFLPRWAPLVFVAVVVIGIAVVVYARYKDREAGLR
jgi:hypothetical protein